MSEAETHSEDLVLSPPPIEVNKQQTLPLNISNVLQGLVERRMWGEQTPRGSILFVDMDASGSGIVVDGKTLKKTGELDLSSERKKQMAASVIVTGPLTPESSEELKAMLENVSDRANIQKGNKEKEVRKKYGTDIIEVASRSGIVVVVERRGEDIDPEWRKKLMQEIGLARANVISGRKNYPIIWEAGRKRESVHRDIDATKSRAGGFIGYLNEDNTQTYEEQGYDVNMSELEADQHATKMIPATLQRSKDFVGVELTDRTTGDIVRRDRRGNEYRSPMGSSEDREIASRADKKAEPKKVEKKVEHKDGDIVELPTTCWECGQHNKERYFKVAGDVRWLLRKETMCNGPHQDGYPKTFGSSEYVRPLGFLPQEMRKKR